MTEVKNVCAAYMLADYPAYVHTTWNDTFYLHNYSKKNYNAI